MNGPHVVCVGAAVVDRLHRATEPVVPGSAASAVGTVSAGGVARNVAEHLARHGTRTTLLTALGADDDAALLRAGLHAAGVALDALEAPATATYTGILDTSGELVVAAVDLRAPEALDATWVIERLGALAPTTVVLDANLTAPALAALVAAARSAPWHLVVETTSVACARRLPADLTGVDLLAGNRRELLALLDEHAGGAHCDPLDPMATLLARGAGAVVLLDSAAGVHAADATGRSHVPAPTVAAVVDATGAGDACTAGVVHALVHGDPLGRALTVGRAWAGAVLSGRGAVPGG